MEGIERPTRPTQGRSGRRAPPRQGALRTLRGSLPKYRLRVSLWQHFLHDRHLFRLPGLGQDGQSALQKASTRWVSRPPAGATETKSEAAAAGLAFLEFPVESQFGSGFFPIATSSG